MNGKDDQLAPRPGIVLPDEQRVAWLRLIRSENVGPATFRDLINHFGSASNSLDALPDLASRGRAGKRIRIGSLGDAENELARLEKLGGRTICLGEPDFPSALRAADNPPPLISVIGSTDILAKNFIAFVGSRNASLSGIKLTRKLAQDVSSAGYATVSGLARGIDSAAHEASFHSGTVAVFAGGIDHVYPTENEKLAREIVESGGALISEMPLGWQPRAQDFPRRNRIVAGMAMGLVVVEAAKRSGSLISARLANEMGRLVFAVPGSPLDPRSEGTNHLIRDGATLIRNANDIIEAIEPISQSNQQVGYTLDEGSGDAELTPEPTQSDRERLMSALDHTPNDIDEIMRFTGLKAAQLQMLLLELDLAGRLERHPGNRVSLQ